MIGANKMSGSHLHEVNNSRSHFPQTNWLKVAKAFECIPSLNKFMGSNFLYSLESQKLGRDREMAARLGVLL
jgi:bloom syndrome protein